MGRVLVCNWGAAYVVVPSENVKYCVIQRVTYSFS